MTADNRAFDLVPLLTLLIAGLALIVGNESRKFAERSAIENRDSTAEIKRDIAEIRETIEATKIAPKLSVNAHKAWFIPMERKTNTIQVGHELSNGQVLMPLGSPAREFHVVDPILAGGFVASNHAKNVAPVTCVAEFELREIEPAGLKWQPKDTWEALLVIDSQGEARVFLGKMEIPSDVTAIHGLLTLQAKHPISGIETRTYQKARVDFYASNIDTAVVHFEPPQGYYPLNLNVILTSND